MTRAVILSFLMFASVLVTAQEELSPLLVNPQLYNPHAEQGRVANEDIIYLIDTLSLPFQDDFSINRIKLYNACDTDTVVSKAPWEKYHLNGSYVDTLEYMNDTTFTIILNASAQPIDTVPNATILIERFSPVYPFNVDTTFSAWPNFTGYAQAMSFTIEEMKADSVLLNIRDTFLLAADDTISYWIDNNAFINTSYGIDPPTIGVATLDGLDATGYPYNGLTNPNAHGQADVLTSKPIDLGGLLSTDDVWFSFFYQPEGYGNEPDPEDSLVLEFFAPQDNQWYWIWSKQGQDHHDFLQVFLQITDAKFLQKGFQFRFRNYATISGNFDHWSIDYVRLDKNRSSGDEIDDVAFHVMPASMVQAYTAMPWDHYSDADLVSTARDSMTNLSSTAKLVTSAYLIFDEADNPIYTSPTVTNPSASPGTKFVQSHSVAYTLGALTGKTYFKYIHGAGASPDGNRDNDSIPRSQVFDTYYSYDDGTGEKAYALAGQAARLAYEFDTDVEDTLKAVLIHFPYMMENVTQLAFRIKVWTSLSPEVAVYTSTVQFPQYGTSLNQFIRYELDSVVKLKNTWYVGYEQVAANKLYIGFDENIRNEGRIWYNTSGSFFQTGFTGSLMIRPDFGEAEPFPLAVKEVAFPQTMDIEVFPNPTNGRISIQSSELGMDAVALFNTFGQQVHYQQLTSNNQQLDLSHLPNGVYLLQATGPAGTFTPQRIVIAR